MQRRRVEPAALVEEEEQPLPPPKEVEAVSSPSFSDWSSSDNDSERNLEDNEDAVMETSEDSPHMEWWEEEEDEILEEPKALQSPLRADMAVYRPARSFPSEDSLRLRTFGRMLQRGARHLRVTHHAPRMAKVLPPLPPSSSSRRTRRGDVLRVALIS
jgi:hypothetical protein